MVGVILLNWNGLADTIDCIRSIQEDKTPGIVIYVVDNASKNNEGDYLETTFPQVRVLKQAQNLGFCTGNNVGIKQAIADGAFHIIVLNNDTLVPVNAIPEMVRQFDAIPRAGALSPVILEHPATDKVWFAKAQWDASRAQFDLNPEKKNYAELQKLQPWKTEFACGCCLVTSATMINDIGVLDERYFAYYDEADWCKRLERKGFYSYTSPASFIYHKVSKTTPGLVSTYLLTRNRRLWMKENLSFGLRMKSFSYLFKELIWHFCNARGWVKGPYSKAHSRAFLRGWKDYQLGRFGRWNENVEKIIFPGKG